MYCFLCCKQTWILRCLDRTKNIFVSEILIVAKIVQFLPWIGKPHLAQSAHVWWSSSEVCSSNGSPGIFWCAIGRCGWWHCFMLKVNLTYMYDDSTRKGMRGYFSRYWLIMWKRCFRLCIPQLSVKHAKNMDLYLGVHMVFISASKSGKFFLIIGLCERMINHLNWIMSYTISPYFRHIFMHKGKDLGCLEELVRKACPSDRSNWWWTHSRTRRPRMPGYFFLLFY